MATTLQFRRYTTSQLSSLTGSVGELFVDTDKETVVVQDGSTSGGFPLARESALSAKQDSLVSGTNIKTVNSTSLLGSGNISVQESLVSGTNIKTVNSASLLGSGNISVQESLVSGTNIKTVNSTSLLGSGDISVQESLVSGTNIKTVNGSSLLGSGNITISAGADLSDVSEDILPALDEVYDIGATDKRWFDVFVSNSLDINGSTFTATSNTITTTSDMVVGSLLVDDLLLSDNLITPDASTVRQYGGNLGWAVVNGNLDVEGDLLQLPVAETVDSVPPLTTGIEGSLRFNKDTTKFEGYNGTAWGSLGGISADDDGNATIDANLIVTGDVISLSDENLKENIAPVENALNIIGSINGVYYNLKSDPETPHVGVIAQNVEEVLPEVVYNSNGNKSVAYGNIVAVLIEAVKELKAEVESLKGE